MIQTVRRPLGTWDGYSACLRKLWEAPWFKSKKPSDTAQGELWDARVALIDAYVYERESEEG
jgi:hypothetical protein